MQSRVVYLGAPNPNIFGEYLESKPEPAPLLCLEQRRPKFLIVLTMYNEGPQELHASLWGIFYNIKQRAVKLGGADQFSWRDYLLVIVQDGLTQFFNEGDAAPGEGPRARFMHEIGIYNHDDFVGLTQSIAGEEDGDPLCRVESQHGRRGGR